jgi:hypothetical protein
VSAGEHSRLPLPASGVWSQAKLSLSADADVLYLTARGVHASSHLYVSESHEAKEVSVAVFVQHRRARSLSRATVCRLSRGSGEMGVGIFVCRLYLLYHFPNVDSRPCRLHLIGICPGSHMKRTCASSSKWNFPPYTMQFVTYRLSTRTYPCSRRTWVTYRLSALVMSI